MTNQAAFFAQQIRNHLGDFVPQTAIILGSGLGKLADNITSAQTISYSAIEGFPQTTVSGHKGAFIAGKIAGHNVICLQGRFHLYEGHNPAVIAEVIQTLKLLGVQNLIVTNAAGSLDPDMPPASLMLISDHINFSGRNPLVGANDDQIGPRFPDVSNAYDYDFRQQLKQIALENNIPLHEGVYLMVLGPNFETAAEIKAFRILGADAVGMSTVPEVLAAVHCGLRVAGISVITNFGTGMKTSPQSHAETLAQADKASQNLLHLVQQFIRKL